MPPPSNSATPPHHLRHSTTTSLSLKWWGFVSALWIQCISGNNYTFANYSVQLKTVLSYNQVQLNGLSSAKDVGKAFGVVAGLMSDYFPPWTILLVGSVEGMVGYGVQWLVISQRISPLPYWLMCVVMCMGGNSTTWMNTAVLVTCLRNFRRNRGPVSGILKAYVGLSTAIFTDLCSALFTGDASTFVLMLALLPFAVCIVGMFLLRPLNEDHPTAAPADDGEESRCFAFLNSAAIVLAVYLLVYDLSGVSGAVVTKVIASVLIVLLLSPAVLPIYLRFKVESKQEQRIGGGGGGGGLQQPLLAEEEGKAGKEAAEAAEAAAVAAAAVAAKKRKQIGEDHTVVEALQTVDFWLLFFCFLCGVGTGMAVINNMGQIGESLGYSTVAIFVSMISIWGFFGRLGSGALTEWLILWKGIPRPAVLAASQVIMVAGYLGLASGAAGSLYFGSAIVGLCYGVRLSVSVPVSSELFGLKSFGLIYNLLILNLPLGSFLFSSLLAGFLYDMEAAKQGSDTSCTGVACYRVVFLVMAAVSTIGCGLDILLTLRTRSLYAEIRRGKLAEAAAAAAEK